MRKLCAAALFYAFAALNASAQELSEQKFAALGDFRLDSGATMRDCRVGYRTAGQLNADRSNAIVVPTWFAGRSGDLAGWVGPAKLVDTSRWFVVAVDAFGDGVSTSPSNSTQRPFPQFTMRDMVRSQYELVTRELKIAKLNAVVGFSMGGMQAFQWLVSYPDFVKKVVPVAGTTRQTAHDLMLWQTELELLQSFSESADDLRKAMRTVAAIQAMEIRTPAWIVQNVADVTAHLETHRKSLETRDPFDYMSQLRAMIGHDIFREFNGSVDEAVRVSKARLFIVVALQDQMVNAGPSREFARKSGAAIITLTGDCGHLATACERDLLMREVPRFLAE